MLGGEGPGGSAPVGGGKVAQDRAVAGTYAAAAIKRSPALQKLRSQKNDPSRSPGMFRQQIKKAAQQAAKTRAPKAAMNIALQELKNKMAQKEKKAAQIEKQARMQRQKVRIQEAKLIQEQKKTAKLLAHEAVAFAGASDPARKVARAQALQAKKQADKAAQMKRNQAELTALMNAANVESRNARIALDKVKQLNQQMKNNPGFLQQLKNNPTAPQLLKIKLN